MCVPPEPARLSVTFALHEPNLITLPPPLYRPLLDSSVAATEADLQRYDWSTLFYDVFVRDRVLYLLGPPLLALESIALTVHCNGAALALQRDKLVSIAEKLLIWTAPLPDQGGAELYNVEICFALARVRLVLADCAEPPRRPERVLVTLQRDNAPRWIADWIAWYAEQHGVERVLIYDNRSAYQAELGPRLAAELARCQGGLGANSALRSVTVVPWNVPFGMIINYNHNNFFAQHGALNHAARRFARRGDVLFNFDVDELLVCPRAELGRLLRERALLYFDSYWVPIVQQLPALPEHYSFDAFALREPRPRGKFHKWVMRWDGAAKLCLHTVLERRPLVVPISTAYYLHYRGITTFWKKDIYRQGAAKAEIDQRYALASPSGLVPI